MTTATQYFGIGTVAKRTGLTTPNIRVWETRHQAVKPKRTESGRRLYTAENIDRLTLLKRLVDVGHSIGKIAHLDDDQLKQRLAEEGHNWDLPNKSDAKNQTRRVITIGPGLAEFLNGSRLLEIEVVEKFDELSQAELDTELHNIDMILFRVETLFAETVARLRNFVVRTGAKKTILICRFTQSATVSALTKTVPGLTMMTAPVSDNELWRECIGQLDAMSGEPKLPSFSATGPIPENLFSTRELTQLSRIASSVDCECPKHLAELIQGLTAFEQYSSECENRSPSDTILHSFLHRRTAQVRRSMEDALNEVLRIEGINLSELDQSSAANNENHHEFA